MNNGRHIRVIIILSFCILIAGFLTAFFISKNIDDTQRSELIKEAQQASLLAPPTSIASLSADQSDLGNNTYGVI